MSMFIVQTDYAGYEVKSIALTAEDAKQQVINWLPDDLDLSELEFSVHEVNCGPIYLDSCWDERTTIVTIKPEWLNEGESVETEYRIVEDLGDRVLIQPVVSSLAIVPTEKVRRDMLNFD